MKLHILGCLGAWPGPGPDGATSGYLVEAGETRLLMDCGSGVMSRLIEKWNPADLSAILLSHLHADHACDLLVLRYYLEKAGVRLPVFVPPEDASPLRSLLSCPAFDVQPYPDSLQIGMISVRTLPVRHPVPCRALRLTDGEKTLVFTGDTNDCPPLGGFAQGADVLLADAAFLQEEWNESLPHMSAAGAAKAAAQAGVKALLLTHLPHHHAPETLEKEACAFYPGAKTVYPGMVICL